MLITHCPIATALGMGCSEMALCSACSITHRLIAPPDAGCCGTQTVPVTPLPLHNARARTVLSLSTMMHILRHSQLLQQRHCPASEARVRNLLHLLKTDRKEKKMASRRGLSPTPAWIVCLHRLVTDRARARVTDQCMREAILDG